MRPHPLLVALAIFALSCSIGGFAVSQTPQRRYLPQIYPGGIASQLVAIDEVAAQRSYLAPMIRGEQLLYKRSCSQVLAVGPAPGLDTVLTEVSDPANCRRIAMSSPMGDQVLFTLGYRDFAELWSSDGTQAGTKLVRTFASPEPLKWLELRSFSVLGDAALFFSNSLSDAGIRTSELWRSDGTPAGTTLLKTFGPLRFPAMELPVLKGRFYFSVFSPDETMLWMSDGTVEGTQPVTSLPSWVYDYGLAGGKIWFATSDQTYHYALWVSDGTAVGTHKVRHLDGKVPVSFTTLGEHIYFALLSPPSTSIFYLWTSDGTEAGTRLVADVGFESQQVAGDLIYFKYNGYLYASDGTTAGTRNLKVSVRGEPLAAGGRLFFATHTSNGYELWMYDGAGVPRRVSGFGQGLTLNNILLIAASPTTLYVATEDEAKQAVLWAVHVSQVR